MAPADKRLRPGANSAAIRCYGQGLGDCFLLAFPRPDSPRNPCYVVIDCGVAKGTPDEEERMQRVVADIHAATGGHLDVLAVTHQHYDHVIGFVHAEERWRTFQVEQLFLPWTEKPDDEDAATIGKAALRLGRAAQRAAARAARLAETANRTGLRLTDGLLAAGSESFGIGAAEGIERGWKIALDLCPQQARVFCEPGDETAAEQTGRPGKARPPHRHRSRSGHDRRPALRARAGRAHGADAAIIPGTF